MQGPTSDQIQVSATFAATSSSNVVAGDSLTTALTKLVNEAFTPMPDFFNQQNIGGFVPLESPPF